MSVDTLKGMTRDEVVAYLQDEAYRMYEERERELGAETLRDLERVILLRVIDEKWMDHIDAMDQLREGINLRAYGQRDPLIEYKFEAYDAYQMMERSIKEDVVRYLFRVRLVSQPQERTMVAGREEEGPRQPVKADKKVGRNDPCPCGSGKKYKKCCGKGAN